jgi:hypothetical protein
VHQVESDQSIVQTTTKREVVKRKDGSLYTVTTEVEEYVVEGEGEADEIVEVVEVIEYE